VFALPETFYGYHPSHEPETRLFTGTIVRKSADDKIITGSFLFREAYGFIFKVKIRRSPVWEECEDACYPGAG